MSASSAPQQAQQQTLDLAKLTPAQLESLHAQLSSELNMFTSSMIQLQQTASRFASAGQSVESLKEYKEGQRMMIPLTESLYCPGELSSPDRVLLEIGTGYYVERDVEAGIGYCRGKVMGIKEQVAELSRVLQQRQQILMRVEGMLQEKAR